MTKNFFFRNPTHDSVLTVKNYLQKDKGLYFFFRTNCIKMQERFVQLADCSMMPKVFLHGNPHLDNYVKTDNGSAMIDFDRSRFGPYAWDIVRLLSSIALRKTKSGKKFLHEIVVDYFFEGYMRSFSNTELPFKAPTHLGDKTPEKWQKNINNYLKSNNAWAKKLKESPISPSDETVFEILSSYLESRNDLTLLNDYHIEKAGKAIGSLQNKRFLVLLSPNSPFDKGKDKKQSILLDLKTVYQDPDNEWFYNPYKHHGLRMIKAAELYAPKIEEMLGYATYKGEQYWGRAIPSFSYKIKNRLNQTLQLDIAYSVGTQLGKAHRNSIQNTEPAVLLRHFEENYTSFVKLAEQMSREVVNAHTQYVDALRKNNIILGK
jgi:hypothetical protein